MAGKSGKVFTSGEVAQICGVSADTVSRWFDLGQIEGYRLGQGGDRRIPYENLRKFMLGHGIRPPAGEYYSAVEGANGELGFYVISDGGDRPYRVRVRPPCFTIMSALHELIIGETVADIVPTFGSINMIGGELDR